MSIRNAPSIVTNVLVAGYDMSNGSKSFIGAPTTNLAEFPATGYNWINSGSATYTNDDTTEALPDIPNLSQFTTPLKVVSCQTTVASTQGQECGYAFTSVSGSTQYTMSLWFKKNRDDMASYGPYVRQAVNNDWHGTFDYNGETNNALWPTNKWIRIKSTFTTSSNETGVYLSNYIGQYVGDKVCYCGGQLEQKSFASPLAQGTRSTSNNIFSITGDKAYSSNLTYNSDGTFSFNGADGYVNLGASNTYLPMPQFTLESWHKSSGLGSGMNTGALWGITYGIVANIYSDGNVTFNTYNSDTSSNYSVVSTSGANLFNNAWRHVVYVVGPSTSYIYVDGVLNASASNSGSWSGTNVWSSMAALVGNDPNNIYYYFNGQIPIARIYNRALTASEVAQNFNAHRGRFGR